MKLNSNLCQSINKLLSLGITVILYPPPCPYGKRTKPEKRVNN